jgi:pimeloyl-ACP methyl ester carboxylesterase
MKRRDFLVASATAASTALAANPAQADGQVPADAATKPRPDQRLARKYQFDDHDMDLFFMAAMGWGPAGGLDVGQVFHVASNIQDGDPDSWVKAFHDYGRLQDAQAHAWKAKGWHRAAGEARLKAFSAYRSAWQFAGPGDVFRRCYMQHQEAFALAMAELRFPATFFQTPYAGKALPGVYFQNPSPTAPVVLVVGGADTCFEDLFLTAGRNLLDRGYSVALVDLPGQGITPASGLHWEAAAEKPIAAVIDVLIERFRATPGKIALLGLSLGGYFAARAAGAETRLATVMASTPFPNPAQLFALTVRAATAPGAKPPTAAGLRSAQMSMWKAGAQTPEAFVERTAGMVADPSRVTVPFLSILGTGDSAVFAAQARQWHASIRSTRKSFVELDAATGADAHVQVANRLRLVQEAAGWMDDIFA